MGHEWGQLLEANPKILWGIVADVVKDVKAGEGERKTGRRPAASVKSLDELYEVLFPVGYALEPFGVALGQALKDQGMSQHQLAIASGIHQTKISRLISGHVPPTVDYIQRCSQGLKVNPTYFIEYRALRLGELITEHLLTNPTLSAELLRRLFLGAAS